VGDAADSGADADADADAAPDESLPVSFEQGRVENRELHVQGIVFAEADSHTAETMTSNLARPVDRSAVDACIQGVAAKVDLLSVPCTARTFTPPASDCFSEYWGAKIGMQLNQAQDTGEGGVPEPFDASALKGFSFEIGGALVPLRSALRFQVEAAGRMFCSSGVVKIVPGTNRVLFDQLVEDCFRYTDPNEMRPTAEEVQSQLLEVSWHVLTNNNLEVPFDFCVSNVRALLK